MIVSMSTENYAEWLYLFLKSIEQYKLKTTIFLINFPSNKAILFSQEFPDVNFEFLNLPVDKKEGTKNVFKVTYLKGECIKRAFEQNKEPILWIDCTALIRSNPNELLDKLATNKALLMRRDTGKDFGKKVYACEIFGMNDYDQIIKYKNDCEKRKKEWFADQLALCEIKEKEDFPHGEWSNFHYEESAKSWSDRGKKGLGTNTQEDIDFTKNKFKNDLENRTPGFLNKHLDFMREINLLTKMRILVHTDDEVWCYYQTVKQFEKYINAEFTIISNADKQAKEIKEWQGDLVWARCSSKRHQKLLAIRPDLRKISYSSVTTGGELAEDRIMSEIEYCKGEAGIICQNEEVKKQIEIKLKKLGRDQKVYILYNAVDIEKFKPTRTEHKTVVGFAGRTRTIPEDLMKGLTQYIKPVCEELGLELKTATNQDPLSYDQMPEFYNSIDCLVLLSNCEGHSNTINEAMACGLPVIAFPVGWHYENARTEILWCQRSVKELYRLLNSFKSVPETFQEIGARNRKFAEEHLDIRKVAKYYESQFRDMILNIKPYTEEKPDNLSEFKQRMRYKGKPFVNSFGKFQTGHVYNLLPDAIRYMTENRPNDWEVVNVQK